MQEERLQSVTKTLKHSDSRDINHHRHLPQVPAPQHLSHQRQRYESTYTGMINDIRSSRSLRLYKPDPSVECQVDWQRQLVPLQTALKRSAPDPPHVLDHRCRRRALQPSSQSLSQQSQTSLKIVTSRRLSSPAAANCGINMSDNNCCLRSSATSSTAAISPATLRQQPSVPSTLFSHATSPP